MHINVTIILSRSLMFYSSEQDLDFLKNLLKVLVAELFQLETTEVPWSPASGERGSFINLMNSKGLGTAAYFCFSCFHLVGVFLQQKCQSHVSPHCLQAAADRDQDV